MKSKKYVKFVAIVLIFAFALTTIINVIVDPLFQYHKPWFGLQPVVTNERYQNAGIAKNFDFDNAIIGNSMSENFKCSDVSELLGGETVKLVAAGSHPIDWIYLLKILERKEKQPKRIIINIDDYIFKASTTELKHELPTYLYDNSCLNDVNYLFNFKILKEYTLNTLKSNLKNEVPSYDEAFMWNENIGKEYVLKDYERKPVSDSSAEKQSYIDLALENMELLIPYIEKMPNTEFIFFFSPFSMLAYDELSRGNMLDAFNEACIFVCERLFKTDNTGIYFLNNQEYIDIICNLDLYRDSAHYNRDVSKKILQSIKDKACILNKKSYKNEINMFFTFVKNYNFDKLFE